MEVLTKSTNETKDLAFELAKKLKSGDVLALYGDLGSGKTTFVRYLVEALGFGCRVQSPTFVLLRKYMGGNGAIKCVNHLDLYRLVSKEELSDLGLTEVFTEQGCITVIEWPELLEEYLPESTLRLSFEYVDECSRRIYVQDSN